jgi:hypothetical protein
MSAASSTAVQKLLTGPHPALVALALAINGRTDRQLAEGKPRTTAPVPRRRRERLVVLPSSGGQ